jgi:hypothetical protein
MLGLALDFLTATIAFVGAMFVVVEVEERKHKDLGLIKNDTQSDFQRRRRSDVKAQASDKRIEPLQGNQ